MAIGILISPVGALVWYDLSERGDPTRRLDLVCAAPTVLMIGSFGYASNHPSIPSVPVTP